MRTNIEIDDVLMVTAMKVGGFTTKKATVEEALREMILDRERRQALKELRGMGWSGDLEEMRNESSTAPSG
jgi:Arc/MetJ family transcription regulator